MPTLISMSQPFTMVPVGTAVGAAITGTTFALPTPALLVSWQVFYGTPPASTTINFQISNDGVTFSTTDATTAVVNGVMRITACSARFARITMSAVAGGDTFSVIAVFAPLGTGKDLYGGNTIVATAFASVQNPANTGENDLFAITLNARSLVTNGHALRMFAAGNTNANANTKTIRIRFGGDTFVVVNSGINNVDWTTEFWVMRRSFGIQQRRGITNLNAVSPGVQVLTIAVDETAPIIFRLTAQSGTGTLGDVTLQMLEVSSIPTIPNII